MSVFQDIGTLIDRQLTWRIQSSKATPIISGPGRWVAAVLNSVLNIA